MTVRFRFASDCHQEHRVAKRFDPAQLWTPPPLPEDRESVLLLAGDLWRSVASVRFGERRYSWIGTLSARFRAVGVVLGNHDAWTDNIPGVYRRYAEALADFDNVHLLESAFGYGPVEIAGVRIVGSTLWTDVGRGNPLAMSEYDLARGCDGRPLWNDRNFIRVHDVSGAYRRFSAFDMVSLHGRALNGLRQQVADPQPTVLVTHMAPALASIQGEPWEGIAGLFYASDLSAFLAEHPWIRHAVHGHVHKNADYRVGDCRVLCNPVGYPTSPNEAFDPYAYFDVSPALSANAA